jgi:hypothetical protein
MHGPLRAEEEGETWVSRSDIDRKEESTDMSLLLTNTSKSPVTISSITPITTGATAKGAYLADAATTTPGIEAGFPPENTDGAPARLLTPNLFGPIDPGASALVAVRLRRDADPAAILSGVRVRYRAAEREYEEEYAYFALLCAKSEKTPACTRAIETAQKDWWKSHDRRH